MVMYQAASSRRYRPCASTNRPDADRAAEQMRELENRQRHEVTQPVDQRLPAPGVAPENSSTAPAPNTAIALACGVTALSQVRPSSPIRTMRPAVRPELVRAEQRERHAEWDQVINDAISEQRAEQLIGAARSGTAAAAPTRTRRRRPARC